MVFRLLWKTAVSHEWEGLMKEKLQQVDGDLIGEIENIKLLSAYNQLDDFKTIVFTIVGKFKCKTLHGCDIHLMSEGQKHSTKSDTQEIDTDYSPRRELGLTEIEMELDEDTIRFIRNHTIDTISFFIDKAELCISVQFPEIITSYLNFLEE